MESMIYVNGAFRPAADAVFNFFDHGLLYGDGVFEGIRAYNGRVFKLERHIERLFDSAKAIRLQIPASFAEACDAVVETCRTNALTDAYLRVVVTRGPGNLTIDPRSCKTPQMVIAALPALNVYKPAGRGLTIVTSSFRRPAPDTLCPSIKSLNYLNNVMARIEANDRGADEALLLDTQGYVTEASVDNIFIVTPRGLRTPPTPTNLKGITRETVLGLAATMGIHSEEAPMTLFDVWTAAEVFVCGTAAEIVPVVNVDGRQIGTGDIGTTTVRLMTGYRDLVRSMGTPISPAAEAPRQALTGSFRV